jgi:hypothetical protein
MATCGRGEARITMALHGRHPEWDIYPADQPDIAIWNGKK